MNNYIINSFEEFKQLQAYVKDNSFEFVFVDVETDSKIEKLAKLYGVGVCFNDEEAFYIPIRKKDTTKWWTEEQEKEIADWLYEVCSQKKLINHNIIYDVLVIQNNWGYDLTPFIYSDTILQKHALEEEKPFGLKEIAEKYLGSWAVKARDTLYENIKQNGGRTTKEHMEMFKADTDILGVYCCFDVLITCKLFHIFEKRIQAEGLADLFYKDEVMPLYREVTIPMKQNGFPIDVEHFKNLNFTITEELNNLEKEIQEDIKDEIKEYIDSCLEEEYPIKRGGSFPKFYAKQIGFELPKNKDGNVTLAKKELLKLPTPTLELHKNFMNWLGGAEIELCKESIKQLRHAQWFLDNSEEKYIFNLASNNDLKWLFFEKLCETPLSYTETEQPQVDDGFLDSIKDNYEWVHKLVDLKKLNKLKGTYIEGILERHIDGVIYTSMLQFGTTSNRYSSTNPNLQNLPSVKEDDSGLSERVLKYANQIRAGFVAPKGYKIVDADQSALEPRCFASVSGDKNLQNIFFSGEDMYSSIAIRSFGVTDSSPFKKDKNYLGVLHPELRKLVKTYCLAVAYGAGAGRIAQVTGKTKEQAQELINDYLTAYPGLKRYIDSCHLDAKLKGYVKTKFGRIRHLPRIKELYGRHGNNLLDWKYTRKYNLEEIKYEFKNGLNNSTNMPIQGLAAHIMNRSAIAIARQFKQHNINGYLALQIHDQLIAIIKEEDCDKGKLIIQDRMENTIKIEVPLIAEPKIADNLKDSH